MGFSIIFSTMTYNGLYIILSTTTSTGFSTILYTYTIFITYFSTGTSKMI